MEKIFSLKLNLFSNKVKQKTQENHQEDHVFKVAKIQFMTELLFTSYNFS